MERHSLNPITSLWHAEQHIYGIPCAGRMESLEWAELTSEERRDLRSLAFEIWREYLENRTTTVSHPHIWIPEYRQMLSQPDGELIVEEF